MVIQVGLLENKQIILRFKSKIYLNWYNKLFFIENWKKIYIDIKYLNFNQIINNINNIRNRIFFVNNIKLI